MRYARSMRTLLYACFVALGVLSLSGCMAIHAVGTAADVAGTAVSTTADVAGSVVSAGADTVSGKDD